jgi:hypothetical protein
MSAMLAGSAFAAPAFTAISSWSGSTGYIYGRPLVLGGVVYGVIGYPPPPSGSKLTGNVYALTPPSTGSAYTQSSISSFSGGSGGGSPGGGLHADANGNLYGAAGSGGITSGACAASGLQGCGLIYQLSYNGSSWTRNTIYSFIGGTDGIAPVGDLISDSTGALYGVTAGGGCAPTAVYPIGCGIVFKLTAPQSGNNWTETVLYRFAGGATDGATPIGPLARDAAGNIYGATEFGGTPETLCGTLPSAAGDGACGTVFMLANNGGSYSRSILHFFTDGSDGSIPSGGIVLDKNANLFGTTLQGGITASCENAGYSGCGLVFELSKASGYAAKSTVHAFNGVDGAQPSDLLVGGGTKLFGVTSENSSTDTACTSGSAYYCGTVFKLQYANAGWNTAMLYKFSGTSSIAGPDFGLAADTAGRLFGVSLYNVTSTAFMLTPPHLPMSRRRPHW